MPILYIHGIAIREEGEPGWPEVSPFVQSVAWPGVQRQLREHLAPILNPQKPDDVQIEQVYWGNLGAKPLYPAEPAPEPAPADLPPAELAEVLESQVRREMPLQAWPEVIDTVWQVAHDAKLRSGWRDLPPEEQWAELHRVTEAELHRRWHAAHPVQPWPWLAQFRQVFRRRLMLRMRDLRGPLEGFLPYFMGDILTYLRERGSAEQPGAIPRRVLDSLARLHTLRQQTGEPLIVLTHSMGGQLLYDALTTYAPAREDLRDLRVDFWCASASQLALFGSLSLFRQPTSPDGTLPRPASVGYLWNVWSPNDLLSFQATPAVNGAHDAAVALTSDVLKAHAEYLIHPAFYQALATKVRTTLRLAERAADSN